MSDVFLRTSAAELRAFDYTELYREGEDVSLDYVMKPYPNEHACRIRDPDDFQPDSFRRVGQGSGENRLFLILGRLKGESKTTLQAFRYPVENWTASRAKAHCSRHDGIEFEPAKKKQRDDEFSEMRHFVAFEPRVNDLNREIEADFYQRIGDRSELEEIAERIIRLGFKCTCEIKGINEEKREIEGYASTRDIDRVGEIILPKAYRSSMKRVRSGAVKILREHVPPGVGRTSAGTIDDHGLYIKARIGSGTIRKEETWNDVLDGTLDAFSVGFRSLADEIRDVDGKPVRVITELDLYEISLVTIPANIGATASVAKGIVYGVDTFSRKGGLWIPTRLEDSREPEARPSFLSAQESDEDEREIDVEEYALAIKTVEEIESRFAIDVETLEVTSAVEQLKAIQRKLKGD